ncbi:MAG: hypothetical protein IAG13_27020, partial [Deltaproteobacteria bacterium]|nr:hypothetical protein [Nannocystaceae bacterium]
MLASLLQGEAPKQEPELAPELVLEWHAPPTCPDAEDVRTRLATYLGDDALPRSHRASGTISPDATGWSLRLVIDGELRELHSPRCETLGDAAAVVLSLAMDPERVPPPEEPPPVVTPIVARSAVAPSPALRPITGRVRRSRLGLRVDGGVSGGIAEVST